MKRLTAAAVVGIISAVWVPSVWAQKPDDKIALGMKIYEREKCSLCHSIGGKGNKKGELDDVGSRLSAEEIRQWMVNPKEMTEKTKSERKPPMKAYPNLSKEEVDALVAYMQSLKKK